MIELFMLVIGAASGGCFVAWRLKGQRTWREVGAVIMGGGPGQPKPPV